LAPDIPYRSRPLDLIARHLSQLHISKMTAFWGVALCNLVEVYRRFRGACCLHRPVDGGSKYLWNVGNLLPDYTAQQPRKQLSSYSPPWEPEISPPSHLHDLHPYLVPKAASFHETYQPKCYMLLCCTCAFELSLLLCVFFSISCHLHTTGFLYQSVCLSCWVQTSLLQGVPHGARAITNMFFFYLVP
jgi:hypothetical protein